MVLTVSRLWNYETEIKGDEIMDGVDCWVLQVKPRQILTDQRFFDGLIWADKQGYNIVRMEGQAVPQIRSTQIGKPVPAVHHRSQADRRQTLVSRVYLRRRHAAIPQRPAARTVADRVQRVQTIRAPNPR